VVDIVLEAGFWLGVVVPCPVVVTVEAEKAFYMTLIFFFWK
jgi:hypothetical protein